MRLSELARLGRLALGIYPEQLQRLGRRLGSTAAWRVCGLAVQVCLRLFNDAIYDLVGSCSESKKSLCPSPMRVMIWRICIEAWDGLEHRRGVSDAAEQAARFDVKPLMAKSGLCNSVSFYRPEEMPTVDHQIWCLAVKHPGQDVQNTEKYGGIGGNLPVLTEHVRMRTGTQEDASVTHSGGGWEGTECHPLTRVGQPTP